jgi:GNAT superfamily N-acetyltransferase
VSTKATYRMPAPRDLPALVGLVRDCYRESRPGAIVTAEQVLATARELDRNREKGSLFVFEREGRLAGYAILIQSWSNGAGGTILGVEELYVEPRCRRLGIASDFLSLLKKVAPPAVVAFQLSASRGNRAALALSRKLGFQESNLRVYSMPAQPE